jgi:hypothetical protein
VHHTTLLFFPVQDALEELAPLSAEQQHIADRIVAGHSVFFTGCAGAVSTVLYIFHAIPRAGAAVTAGISAISCEHTFTWCSSSMHKNVHHAKSGWDAHLLPISFCERQMRIVTSAGTGKSLLLKHILRALPQATTYVTASTGLAASVLGGTTLNAFAGIQQSCRLCAVYG